MTIVFSPSLGETITIPVLDRCDEQETIKLRFIALLGDQDYEKVVDGSMRVQLWSDVACLDPAGQAVKGWKAIDFEILSCRKIGQPESLNSISLCHDDEEDISITARKLVACVSLAARDIKDFAFTYRIKHASGDIKWLGAYGSDGRVVIAPEARPGLQLDPGWRDASVLGLDALSAAPIEIANLSDIADYCLWALPRDPYSRGPTDCDTELLIVIARQGVLSQYTKASFLLQASPGLAISISPAGSLFASGSGSITLDAFYDPSRLKHLLKARMGSTGGQLGAHIVKDTTNKHLLITSRETGIPVQVVVVPLGQLDDSESATSVVININLDTLAELFNHSNPVTQFSILPLVRAAEDVRFIYAPFTNRTESFRVPHYGGGFMLSPVYDLGEKSAKGLGQEGHECAVSFFCPHKLVFDQSPEGQVKSALPTPPPSPQIKPPKGQVTFAPAEEIIPAPSESSGTVLRKRRGARPEISSLVTSGGKPEGRIRALISLCIYYLVLILRIFVGTRVTDILEKSISYQSGRIPNGTESNVLTEHEIPDENESGSETGDRIGDCGEGRNGSSLDAGGGAEVPRTASGVDHAESPIAKGEAQIIDHSSADDQSICAELSAPNSGSSVVTLAMRVKDTPLNVHPNSTSESHNAISLRTLRKTLSVNGGTPDDLSVTKVDRQGKVGGDGWSEYLVRFSGSFREKGFGESILILISQDSV